ncbi:MAG: hypothetical protein PHC59_10180 [Thomasclavelia ramosa]|nr:hypothetical protein [Thomasclavelia ramosa]
MNVCDYLNEYCIYRGIELWSDVRYQSMIRIIHNYLQNIFDRITIQDINNINAQSYIDEIEMLPALGRRNQIADDLIPPSMVKMSINLLKESFDYLVTKELITENPFVFVVQTRKTVKKESIEWTQEDVCTLFNKCNNTNLYFFLHILFSTQFEISEVLGLRWDDVDIDELNGVFQIRSATKLRRYNKNIIETFENDKVIKAFPNYSTNDTSTTLVLIKKEENIKQVKIPIKLVPLINEWKRKQETKIKENELNLVFLLDNGRPYDQDNMKKNYKEFRKRESFKELTLVKLISYAKIIDENGIRLSDKYYDEHEVPILVNQSLSNGNYKYKQVKKAIKHTNINELLPDTNEVVETKEFIELIKNNDDLKKELLERLKAGI